MMTWLSSLPWYKNKKCTTSSSSSSSYPILIILQHVALLLVVLKDALLVESFMIIPRQYQQDHNLHIPVVKTINIVCSRFIPCNSDKMKRGGRRKRRKDSKRFAFHGHTNSYSNEHGRRTRRNQWIKSESFALNHSNNHDTSEGEQDYDENKDDNNNYNHHHDMDVNSQTRRYIISTIGGMSSGLGLLIDNQQRYSLAKPTEQQQQQLQHDIESSNLRPPPTPSTPSTPPPTYNHQIIPYSTNRPQQKLITLPNNKLKVLLINDIKSSQSTASLLIHGPGQFQDFVDLPGTAHLMEHIIMSFKIMNGDSYNENNERKKKNRKRSIQPQPQTLHQQQQQQRQIDGDLEDWLNDNGSGTSNAFTAYDQTCFHINCQHDIFFDALDRFSTLFIEENVIKTCNDHDIVEREIGRVDDELRDVLDEGGGSFGEYCIELITKSFVENVIDGGIDGSGSSNDTQSHPYSKFSRGSLESLQTIPQLNGINVSKKLIQFFKEYYIPSQAVLVIVTNLKEAMKTISSTTTAAVMTQQSSQLSPFSTLENWVISKFSNILSTKTSPSTNNDQTSDTIYKRYHYPARFNIHSITDERRVLLNEKKARDSDKITIQWILNEDYRSSTSTNSDDYGRNKAIEIAFVLNQIFGRRGSGSLFSTLRENNWIQNKNTLPPQVTVPINVSGFQLLKLELSLTPIGLQSQSDVIASVFDTLNAIKTEGGGNTFDIPESILAQYANTAKLYGYLLAPRPPDAVELSVDVMNYGIDVVNSRDWYRFPSPVDDNAVVVPGNQHGLRSLQSTLRSALQILSDPKNALIITSTDDLSKISRKGIKGVKPFTPILPMISTLLYSDDKMRKGNNILQVDAPFSRILPTNDLIPIILSSPRIQPNPLVMTINNKKKSNNGDSKEDRRGWAVLEANYLTPKMLLPRSPPEPNIRCLFVLQLLSSQPARATAEQAACGELWRQSFEEAIYELSEQGALGGLAYELRFNQWGLRVSILGISQNIEDYTKQIMKRLIIHHIALANGEYSLTNRSPAILEAKKVRTLTPIRKNTIIQTLQKATVSDVAQEGLRFLQSCSGAVCFSQGDLTYDETKDLLNDIEEIFDRSIERKSIKGQVLKSALPKIDDLVDTPSWKPRNGSPCYLSGLSLMCDACGRVLR